MDRVRIYYIFITLFILSNIIDYVGIFYGLMSGYEKSYSAHVEITNSAALTKKTAIIYGHISDVKPAYKENRFNNTLSRRAETSFNRYIVRHIRNQYPHYVMSQPINRLGNQMFEFASSFGIARSLNYSHIVISSHPLLKYFDITKTNNTKVINLISITENRWRNETWRTNNKYLSYNITFKGFFHSHKFFDNVSGELRKLMTIKSHFKNQARLFLQTRIHGANKTLIGIHIRRGDYLSKILVKLGAVVASALYVDRAKLYFRQKYKDPVFVVISNDIKWCKENIADNNTIFSTFKTPIIDLALMTLCHHMIISSGTFSWWCGWFCSGNVVYLKDYPRPGSPFSTRPQFREGFNLPTWVGIGNN